MSSVPLIDVTGFEQLQRKLQEIGDDKKKRAEMLKLLRKVAQGTVKVARRNAPIGSRSARSDIKSRKLLYMPGQLRKSIGIIQGKKGGAKINPTIYVGPIANKKQASLFKGSNFERGGGWYGHFVEYGHNIYRKGFKRKHSSSAKALLHNATGVKSRTAANPFMAKTYNETKAQVTAETAENVTKYIQKTIDRLSR